MPGSSQSGGESFQPQQSPWRGGGGWQSQNAPQWGGWNNQAGGNQWSGGQDMRGHGGGYRPQNRGGWGRSWHGGGNMPGSGVQTPYGGQDLQLAGLPYERDSVQPASAPGMGLLGQVGASPHGLRDAAPTVTGGPDPTPYNGIDGLPYFQDAQNKGSGPNGSELSGLPYFQDTPGQGSTYAADALMKQRSQPPPFQDRSIFGGMMRKMMPGFGR